MEKEEYVPPRAGVPSLSAHEVTCVAPGHRVPATLAHSVLCVTAAVRPPRVEISIVGALRIASCLALVEGGDVDVLALNEVGKGVKGRAEGSERSRTGEEQGSEGNHLRYCTEELILAVFCSTLFA